MLRSIASLAALLAILVAVVYQRSIIRAPLAPVVQGRNNTALFIVNTFPGLHNVHMATIQSLRERHPEVKVHVASWASTGKTVRRLTSDDSVVYHELESQNWLNAVVNVTQQTSLSQFFHRPDTEGSRALGKHMQTWLLPWDGPHYEAMLHELDRLIKAVDPAVTVPESFLWPAIDAVREAGRVHAFISPNMLTDNFPYDQPWLSAYWKYPSFGSDSPFPLPWSHIPWNIWLAIMNRYWLSWTPLMRASRDYIKARGVLHHSRSVDWFGMRRDDTPFISQTLPAASLPVQFVPRNVTCAGPIIIEEAPATQQDPALAVWLARGPTVLVNLGSTVHYDQKRALTMTRAFTKLLDERPRLQVIWKYQKDGDYPDNLFKTVAKEHINSDRFRIVSWLNVNPYAMMRTGHIAAFVHHGGAGSYNDALAYVSSPGFSALKILNPVFPLSWGAYVQRSTKRYFLPGLAFPMSPCPSGPTASTSLLSSSIWASGCGPAKATAQNGQASAL